MQYSVISKSPLTSSSRASSPFSSLRLFCNFTQTRLTPTTFFRIKTCTNHFTQTKFYTYLLLHTTPFTLICAYTNQLLTKHGFTWATFCTDQLLQQPALVFLCQDQVLPTAAWLTAECARLLSKKNSYFVCAAQRSTGIHNVTTNVAPICQGSPHVEIHGALCCQLRIGQALPISFEKAVLLAFDEFWR